MATPNVFICHGCSTHLPSVFVLQYENNAQRMYCKDCALRNAKTEEVQEEAS